MNVSMFRLPKYQLKALEAARDYSRYKITEYSSETA